MVKELVVELMEVNIPGASLGGRNPEKFKDSWTEILVGVTSRTEILVGAIGLKQRLIMLSCECDDIFIVTILYS